MSILTAPWFHDEEAAVAKLESIVWPNGAICPHCGVVGEAYELKGKRARPGLRRCKACKKDFTARVGTIFESSHIPLHLWFQAVHLMASSKKGISSHQLHRVLEVTYKTAWFMTHRIREAMVPTSRGPIGGENKVVESDETFIGGKAKNRAFAKKEPKKHAVIALVDRDGNSYSFHIANVKAKTLRETITRVVDRKSHLVTDEFLSYGPVGRDFAGHTTVNHSADEYVRLGGFAHVNTAECRFSLMKRAVFGTHHSISEAHLSRYLAEWDFKFNTRKMDDGERAALIAKGIEGKRLTYRPVDRNHEPRAVR